LRREGIPRIEVSLLRHWCNTREGVHHPARDARVTERSRLLPGHLFQSRDSASARTDAGLVRRQCGWQAGAGSHVARRSRMVLTAVASGAAASASRLGCAKSSGSTACGMGSSTGVAVFGPKSSAAACTRTHTTQGHRHACARGVSLAEIAIRVWCACAVRWWGDAGRTVVDGAAYRNASRSSSRSSVPSPMPSVHGCEAEGDGPATQAPIESCA
jgi:hypothetical protein